MNHEPITEAAERLKDYVEEISREKRPGFVDFDVTPFVISFMDDEKQSKQNKK